MRRQIILHIGTEKTGSTTLQAFGNLNRKLLMSQGILYPQSPGRTNHLGLSIYASTGATLRDLRQISGLAGEVDFLRFQSEFPELLRAEIEDSGCERVWLSNEHLSSRVRRPAEIARVSDLLKPLASEVRIVAYLRKQTELLVSAYSTSVRSGATKDITIPRSERDYFYNFSLLLDRWSALWGAKSLVVRLFDRGQLKGGDIVADFLDVLGCSPTEAFNMPNGLNKSLDAHALQFLLLFNRHVTRLDGSGLNPDYGQIASVLESLSNGPRYVPPASIMRMVEDMFEASNRDVARRYFGMRSVNLFSPGRYADPDSDQPLSLEKARVMGAAATKVLDDQINRMEARLSLTGKSLNLSGLGDTRRLAQCESVELAVADTARLWRERKQRLKALRAELASQGAAPATVAQDRFCIPP